MGMRTSTIQEWVCTVYIITGYHWQFYRPTQLEMGQTLNPVVEFKVIGSEVDLSPKFGAPFLRGVFHYQLLLMENLFPYHSWIRTGLWRQILSRHRETWPWDAMGNSPSETNDLFQPMALKISWIFQLTMLESHEGEGHHVTLVCIWSLHPC